MFSVCYVNDARQRYRHYINDQSSAIRLSHTLQDIAATIGARVLNVSKQDYHPQGASVTMMVADKYHEKNCGIGDSCSPKPAEALLAHLDKSHLTIHTYPELQPDNGIHTLRFDVDISTCGTISPLQSLDYVLRNFPADVVTLDYRVRGFTRTSQGGKRYLDHEINSIKDFIPAALVEDYASNEINLPKQRLFHSKLMRKTLNLDRHIFDWDHEQLSPSQQQDINAKLRKELLDLYHEEEH